MTTVDRMSAGEPPNRFERFRVEPWVDWIGGQVADRPSLLRRLGNWETRLLVREIEQVEISAPVFICGLARSGSTILLECLAEHSETTTHCYRDYPGILVPVLWDRISARMHANRSTPAERAHGDGIVVTPESPEAIEEMLWMAFHPHGHDPAHDNSIRWGGIASPFAGFFRDHMRKLLWLRRGSRYLSKNNYNLVRLGGLIELFPDARIIVPVRDPVTHIASLMRQHTLFSAAETRHPAALRYMQRVGHYEFGLDRRPLNVGDAETTKAVRTLWQDGREVDGWSLYWANLHTFLNECLQENTALRDATLVVRFEDLCADPGQILSRILAHARLSADEAWVAKLARRIRVPDYYTVSFNDTEQRTIRKVTAGAAEQLGYRYGGDHGKVW